MGVRAEIQKDMGASPEVPVTPKEKPKTKAKPRIEAVGPTHIVEVWRLVEASLIHGGQKHPDICDDIREHPDLIQSHLFNYIQSPGFAGLVAKVGKKPAGVILGNVASRPYGRPSKYAFVWCLWVDPAFRHQGVGKILFSEYALRLRKAGIFHWECQADDRLANELIRETGIPVQKLMSIIGGKL